MVENRLVLEVCFLHPPQWKFRRHNRTLHGLPKSFHLNHLSHDESFHKVKVNIVHTRFKDDLAEALVLEVTLSSKTLQRIKCSMFAACLDLCLYQDSFHYLFPYLFLVLVLCPFLPPPLPLPD